MLDLNVSPNLTCANHGDETTRKMVLGGDSFVGHSRLEARPNLEDLLFRQFRVGVFLACLAGIPAQASASHIFRVGDPFEISHIVVGSDAIQVIDIMSAGGSRTDPGRCHQPMQHDGFEFVRHVVEFDSHIATRFKLWKQLMKDSSIGRNEVPRVFLNRPDYGVHFASSMIGYLNLTREVGHGKAEP